MVLSYQVAHQGSHIASLNCFSSSNVFGMLAFSFTPYLLCLNLDVLLEFPACCKRGWRGMKTRAGGVAADGSRWWVKETILLRRLGTGRGGSRAARLGDSRSPKGQFCLCGRTVEPLLEGVCALTVYCSSILLHIDVHLLRCDALW